MSRTPNIIVPPAPPEPATLTAARRWFLTASICGAALVGALAGIVQSTKLAG